MAPRSMLTTAAELAGIALLAFGLSHAWGPLIFIVPGLWLLVVAYTNAEPSSRAAIDASLVDERTDDPEDEATVTVTVAELRTLLDEAGTPPDPLTNPVRRLAS